MQQPVRELGHGEDEHQVEEQLDVGDAAALMAAALAQMAGAGCDHGARSTAWQATGSLGGL